MTGSTCFLCKIRPGINPTHDVKATTLLRSNDQSENKFALFDVFPLHSMHVLKFHLYVLYKRTTLPLTFVFVCGMPSWYKGEEQRQYTCDWLVRFLFLFLTWSKEHRLRYVITMTLPLDLVHYVIKMRTTNKPHLFSLTQVHLINSNCLHTYVACFGLYWCHLQACQHKTLRLLLYLPLHILVLTCLKMAQVQADTSSVHVRAI